MLTRWRATKNYKKLRDQDRSTNNLLGHRDFKMAKRWRKHIIRKLTKKVTQIKNIELGPSRIRDLNDEINDLLEEKKHWNDRIERLGGPDYSQVDGKIEDEGREVRHTYTDFCFAYLYIFFNFKPKTAAVPGYKYFGAAKDLPGIKELFNTAPPTIEKKNRADLLVNIDDDYYGSNDDNTLLEKNEEQQAIRQ